MTPGDLRKESEGFAEVVELLESRIGAAVPSDMGRERLSEFAERLLDSEAWLATQGKTAKAFLRSVRNRRKGSRDGPSSVEYVDLLLGADADANLRTLASRIVDRAAAAENVLIGVSTRPYAYRFVIEHEGDSSAIDVFFNSLGRFTSVRHVGPRSADARSVAALELVQSVVSEYRGSKATPEDDPLASNVLECARVEFERHGIAVGFAGADDYNVRLRTASATIVFAHDKAGVWTRAYVQPGRGSSRTELDDLERPMERTLACLRACREPGVG